MKGCNYIGIGTIDLKPLHISCKMQPMSWSQLMPNFILPLLLLILVSILLYRLLPIVWKEMTR